MWDTLGSIKFFHTFHCKTPYQFITLEQNFMKYRRNFHFCRCINYFFNKTKLYCNGWIRTENWRRLHRTPELINLMLTLCDSYTFRLTCILKFYDFYFSLSLCIYFFFKGWRSLYWKWKKKFTDCWNLTNVLQSIEIDVEFSTANHMFLKRNWAVLQHMNGFQAFFSHF